MIDQRRADQHHVVLVAGTAFQVQDALSDLPSFSKLVTLTAFSPFASAADALNQINSVSEGGGFLNM